jgi:hypothetical protein
MTKHIGKMGIQCDKVAKHIREMEKQCNKMENI